MHTVQMPSCGQPATHTIDVYQLGTALRGAYAGTAYTCADHAAPAATALRDARLDPRVSRLRPPLPGAQVRRCGDGQDQDGRPLADADPVATAVDAVRADDATEDTARAALAPLSAVQLRDAARTLRVHHRAGDTKGAIVDLVVMHRVTRLRTSAVFARVGSLHG